MSLPSSQLHVRLQPEMLRRFDDLAAEFPAIQRAALLRLIIGSVLEKDKEEVVQTVLRQLRKPTGRAARRDAKPPLDTRNRITAG
jgi:hypothetical protein